MSRRWETILAQPHPTYRGNSQSTQSHISWRCVQTSRGKIKLNLHIDQAKDFESPMLSPEELLVRRDRFLSNNVPTPIPSHQCTDEQLSALVFLVNNQSPPYVDFGVWGPSNGRLQRNMKFTAQFPMADI